MIAVRSNETKSKSFENIWFIFIERQWMYYNSLMLIFICYIFLIISCLKLNTFMDNKDDRQCSKWISCKWLKFLSSSLFYSFILFVCFYPITWAEKISYRIFIDLEVRQYKRNKEKALKQNTSFTLIRTHSTHTEKKTERARRHQKWLGCKMWNLFSVNGA